MSKLEWTEGAVINLINAYREQETSWNPEHPTYHNKVRKHLVLGSYWKDVQLQASIYRHHKARTGIADVLKRRGWEVYEEIHCVSSLDSNRRADIVAIHRTQSKGIVLDPTIRFERDALQAQHVDMEKKSIYDSCIPYLSEKYNIPTITYRDGCDPSTLKFSFYRTIIRANTIEAGTACFFVYWTIMLNGILEYTEIPYLQKNSPQFFEDEDDEDMQERANSLMYVYRELAFFEGLTYFLRTNCFEDDVYDETIKCPTGNYSEVAMLNKVQKEYDANSVGSLRILYKNCQDTLSIDFSLTMFLTVVMSCEQG
ncbi:hypothetical protein ANN_19461 [Periplaneta americana]|uniref:Uncharacterized protein n=1 Tax=Periplaneta americana TaxID=6978 RepID=A0ABQ8SA62_PERAM|nr:hypothetical protein ANN_19461 [Periplaneta americana]